MACKQNTRWLSNSSGNYDEWDRDIYEEYKAKTSELNKEYITAVDAERRMADKKNTERHEALEAQARGTTGNKFQSSHDTQISSNAKATPTDPTTKSDCPDGNGQAVQQPRNKLTPYTPDKILMIEVYQLEPRRGIQHGAESIADKNPWHSRLPAYYLQSFLAAAILSQK